MLSSGFPLNKLCKGGKGGKQGFYGSWAHVSTEGVEEKQPVFQVHPQNLCLKLLEVRRSLGQEGG